MTMKRKLRGLIAGLVGLTAAVSAVGGGGLPGSAASCQRSIAIDPQVTASEASRTLTFVVRTNSCAAAGSIYYRAIDGTAKRQFPGQPGDYVLDYGVLEWPAGDLSQRRITATIIGDQDREPPLEDFRVMLINPSASIRIAGRGSGQARIFDDDGQIRYAATDDRICLISTKNSCLPTPPEGLGMFVSPIGPHTIENGNTVIAPIQLNQTNGAGTMVHFRTLDDGLVAGTDYELVDVDVFLPPGVTVFHVEIKLLEPAYSKPGLSFHTEISGYTAGVIADPTGVVTMVI